MHSIGEIVKQFEFHVSPLLHPIKGNIVKYVSDNGETSYTWSISHFYKPSANAATVYCPSATSGGSLKEVEMTFRAYAEFFVPGFEVRGNDCF
jgi:hypothetical protein